MRPPPRGRQDAAVLGNIRCGNVTQVDPDRVLGGAAGLAHVLHYPAEHLALLLVGPSAPDIGSNPYLIKAFAPPLRGSLFKNCSLRSCGLTLRRWGRRVCGSAYCPLGVRERTRFAGGFEVG